MWRREMSGGKRITGILSFSLFLIAIIVIKIFSCLNMWQLVFYNLDCGYSKIFVVKNYYFSKGSFCFKFVGSVMRVNFTQILGTKRNGRHFCKKQHSISSLIFNPHVCVPNFGAVCQMPFRQKSFPFCLHLKVVEANADEINPIS